ncbi:Hypothetical protein CINCED_3A007113 [Cinara cedri]|uniref:THAP-type domain-containing protein n=1 Tax=Cinara cedri TaxID=506608 RepID=A0A5E4MYQ5_9HEMI|nr:Hypothetical protein CINCED_3A007113 [Cinara cedri]
MCSRHFNDQDLYPPSKIDNRRLQVPGAVPSLLLSCNKYKSAEKSSSKIRHKLSLKAKMLDNDNKQPKIVSCSSTMPFNHLDMNDSIIISFKQETNDIKDEPLEATFEQKKGWSDQLPIHRNNCLSEIISFKQETIDIKDEPSETTFEQNEGWSGQLPHHTNNCVSNVVLPEFPETELMKSEFSETVPVKSEYTDLSYSCPFSNSLICSSNDIYHLHNEIHNSTVDNKFEIVDGTADDCPPINCFSKDKSCSLVKDIKIKCTLLQEKHKQKMSYFADIKSSDLSIPIKAKRIFHKTKQHMKQQNNKIKRFRQKIQKLNNRLNLIKYELENCKTSK